MLKQERGKVLWVEGQSGERDGDKEKEVDHLNAIVSSKPSVQPGCMRASIGDQMKTEFLKKDNCKREKVAVLLLPQQEVKV